MSKSPWKLNSLRARRPSTEELPILFDHDREPPAMGGRDDSRRGGKDSDPNKNNKSASRQSSSSFDIWRNAEEAKDHANNNNNESFDYRRRWQPSEESPVKSRNGVKQQVSNKRGNNNEIALDMDVDDQSVISRDSRRVSFETVRVPNSGNIGNDPAMRYQTLQKERNDIHDDDGCSRRESDASSSDSSENACLSHHRRSGLLSRLKSTKSRLIERPEEEVPIIMSARIGKSGLLKSGMIGKGASPDNEDEDDPFADEDVPEDFRKGNFNALTLIQWVSLILIVAALLCSLLIPSLKGRYLWELQLWKWLVLVLVLICGRLVSGWGIRLIVFFIEMNFLLRKRLLYFVYGVRKPVQNCWWLGLVLLAWHYLFDKKVGRESRSKILPYITKILICFLLSTLLWLVKTLIVKVMASYFHVSTYFDRIQETLFNQYVIETLSGPPLIEFLTAVEEEERMAAEVRRLQNAGATIPPDLQAYAFPPPRSDKLQKTVSSTKSTMKFSQLGSRRSGDSGIALEHLNKLNHKNISAWNMKRLMKMVRHGTLSTLDEQIMDQPNESDKGNQIRSEYQATAAAKKIFQNVAQRGSKFIYLEDLMRFMREDEALRTLSVFEGGNEKRRISKSSLKNWMLNAYRERRALALTLNDTKTAVTKLHKIVDVVTGIVIVVIWLVILEIASSQYLSLFSSQVILAAFIFGNTCKTIFEAIIFLFIIHPFDVGDRCEIDGTQMVVEEMNILTTVFLRYDNSKIVFPNSVLSTKPIINFYRSPDMGDAIDFFIHVATPVEKVALLKQRIFSYIEGSKEYWGPDPMIVLKEFDELNKMRMALWVTHKINYQAIGERWERRSRLAEEMVRIFHDLDMPYRLLPIDINVCTMPPINSTRFPPDWDTTPEARH